VNHGGRAPSARWRRTIIVLTALLLSSSALAGCALHGLAFKADKRVTIVTPRDQETVKLPVEVSWTSKIPASADLEYGVFVDSHPMRPGQTIEDWIPSTDSCHHTPGCPNPQWLAQRFVFITTQDHITLKLLPTLTTGGTSAENTHNVTIVLLNRKTGQRVGESAFLTTFVAIVPNLND
jgi:hypothetical protein